MQVTETLSEGLKREYRVVVPASELDAKVNTRLDDLKGKVRINGFRPGKVPSSHLKRMYGRATMAEVIEEAVRDANNQIVSERGFKLASEPKVTLPEEPETIEKVIAGNTDLDYMLAVEIVPTIELADFKDIKLTRPTAEVTDEELEESLQRIADQNKPFVAKPEGAKAEEGDRVTIKFAGKIDGELFDGGSGDDMPVLIGSNSFIPGFEEQLVGIGAGETRTLNVSSPSTTRPRTWPGRSAEISSQGFCFVHGHIEHHLDEVDADFGSGPPLVAHINLGRARIAEDHRHEPRTATNRDQLLHVLGHLPQNLGGESLAVQVMTGRSGQQRRLIIHAVASSVVRGRLQ